MEITIHEEKINHFKFHEKKKGPIRSHKNTLYHHLSRYYSYIHTVQESKVKLNP